MTRIQPINPPALMKPVGFSHGYEVKAGRLLFIAGQVAKDADGRVIGKGDIVTQFRQACENIRVVVTAAGGHMSDIAKLTLYVLDVPGYKARLKELGPVYRDLFGKHYPAMTLVGVRDLFDADDGCAIEIEAVAVLGG
jgi:enamine deaminase RidA (YjgF/YER057c/UK114 family)